MAAKKVGRIGAGYVPPAAASCRIRVTSSRLAPTVPSAVRARCANAEKAIAPSVTTVTARTGCFGSSPRVAQTTPIISQPATTATAPTGSQPASASRTALARPASARPEIGRMTRNAEMPNTHSAIEKKSGEPAAVDGRGVVHRHRDVSRGGQHLDRPVPLVLGHGGDPVRPLLQL